MVGSPGSHICALISNEVISARAMNPDLLSHRDYRGMTQALGIWAAGRRLSTSLFVLSLDRTPSLVPSGAFSNLPHTWASCAAFLKSFRTCNRRVMTENERVTFQCVERI